ncbi:proline-rich domain-containing protein [Anaeroselena agilis]|uniref:Uncharacterized protein n=1 Tax=Anaeroselena agilis TaxID=3063788 RepID=A0ABU3P204_9FIRM|nr:hypothetical protein [Selenomonadales bacterium 4137-cl]
MKKLLGLITIAILLSFATVSVVWASPALNNDKAHQRGEEQRKTAKQPTGEKHRKPSGKENVKSPPANNHSRIKPNRHDRPPVKAGGQKPANRGRDNDKHYNHKPQGPDKVAKKPANDKHRIAPDHRRPAKTYDKIGPPANRGRHDGIRHEQPKPRPHTIHRGHPTGGSNIHRHHSRHRYWPDSGDWHRHFRDWSWFISHKVRGFGACYADDRRDRALYIHFEPQDDNYLYMLESRYGHYTYRARHRCHGGDGWCHYWFRGDNIIAFFRGDDGYSHTFVWRRDEVESHALAIGIITPGLRIIYGSYDADMPPDLADGYTREVLWAVVDDE